MTGDLALPGCRRVGPWLPSRPVSAANEYEFITRWRVRGTAQEVSDILEDVESLPRWWPSVYLEVKVLNPEHPRGVGRRVELHTKGWLPYTLRWCFQVVESHPPHGFTLVAEGDFCGRGEWTLRQDGAEVDVTYDWRVRADKPLLKMFSFLLKPLFSWNHRWAMERGEESLRAELERRRQQQQQQRQGPVATVAASCGSMP